MVIVNPLTAVVVVEPGVEDCINSNFNKQYFDVKSSLINFMQLPNDNGWNLNKAGYLKKFVKGMTDVDNLRQTPVQEFLPDLWKLLNDS